MKKLLEVNYNPSSHKYDDWIDNKYELLDNGKSIKLCNQTTITSNISIYLKNVHVHCYMVVRIHIAENDDGR